MPRDPKAGALRHALFKGVPAQLTVNRRLESRECQNIPERIFEIINVNSMWIVRGRTEGDGIVAKGDVKVVLAHVRQRPGFR